jgi:hypothetical protein
VARFILASLLLTPGLFAQTAGDVSGGIAPEWDLRSSMTVLVNQMKQFQPMLDLAKPDEWKAKGAPDAYLKQLQSTKDGIGYLVASAERLARTPEKLSAALETYFRMQSSLVLLGSLTDAIRKYQSQTLAEQVGHLVAETSSSRDRLQQYIQELTVSREQELAVMNSEAQRCRDQLSRQTPAAPRGERKSNRKSENK